MATNKVYITPGTPIVFKESGGSAVITLKNLGYGAGRISASYDRGAGAQPMRYWWQAVIQFETAAVVGEIVEVLLALSADNTITDGTVGTADAALTAAHRFNLDTIGYLYVQNTSTATNMVISGICYIPTRYFSVGVWNGTAGDNLENTDNASYITFIPIPDDIQASA